MTKRNPPSRTTIRGQRHLLAYITPAEAELLKSRGGTGEFHKGVPSYPEPGMGGRSDDLGSSRASREDTSREDKSDADRRGSGPSSRGRGGGRSSAGLGDSKEKGGRGYSGPDRGGAETRPGSQTPEGKKAAERAAKKAAIEQINKQIALGKTNIQNLSPFDKAMQTFMPFAGFDLAQNLAAQYMGAKYKEVLAQEGSRPVYDQRTGRVTGAYDAYGRLTGRDPERERREEREQRDDNIRRRAALAAPEKDKPRAKKEVIRSDLAKEIEAERIRRREAGLTQLGNRSLLSSASLLGS